MALKVIFTFTHVSVKFLKTKGCFLESGMADSGSNWYLSQIFQNLFSPSPNASEQLYILLKNSIFTSSFWFVFWNSATVCSLLMCTFLHLLHLLNRFPAVHQSPQSRIFCIIFVSCLFLFKLSAAEVINVSRQKACSIYCFLLLKMSQTQPNSKYIRNSIKTTKKFYMAHQVYMHIQAKNWPLLINQLYSLHIVI